MNWCDKFLFSWITITLCVILKVSTEFPIDNFERFSNNNSALKFNHLVVDKNQGWVFVGAANRLYRLYANLTLNRNLSTIPGYRSEYNKIYNKLLILDYCKYRIIACSSSCNNIYPFLCVIYKIETEFSKFVVTGYIVTVDSNVSTVAFIPSNFSKQGKCENQASVLYVGVTFSQKSGYYAIPAVVARSLEDNNLLDVIEVKEKDYHELTKISFRDEWRTKYIVNYVYGFSSESHGYFLTTQMNTTRSSPYISKIIVICLQATFYNSYVEIPIECIDKSQKIYNLVQAAFVAKPSPELAASLSITTEDDVLFGVFARSKESKGAESNAPLRNESALCMFSLKSINDKVVENLEKCSNIKGNRGLEHILPENETCEDIDGVSNFCKKKKPFGGNLPAKSTAVLIFDTLLTAVAAVPKFNSTIVFTGTHTGYLKQTVVKNMKTAWEFNDNLVIEERSPINPDLQFDPNMDHLYAMTDHELVKIKIRNSLPSILHIRPDKGPWEGGTKITITGENVKIRFKGTNITATAAGIPCKLYNVENQSPNEIVCITSDSESKFREGPIDLLVDGIQVTSGPNFAFVNPKIFKIVLEKGPIFGKIAVFIKGEHLDVGNSTSIFVGDTPCPIISINSSDIKCAPQSSNFITDTTFNVEVKIDNWVQTNDLSLGYDKDLENYANKYNQKPAGIPAGGIPFFIRVKGVPYTQQLIFKVFTENQTYESFCNMDHNFIALCHSPQMSDINSSIIDAGDPKIFNYSLTPYNEKNPETCYNNSNNNGNFFLYPDPIFEYFWIVSDKDENAIIGIKGQNINITCRSTDFDMLVGNVKCEGIVVYRTKLMCSLEKSKILNFKDISDHNNNDFSSYENVTVQIGKNVTITVHKQNHLNENNFTSDSPNYILYGVIIFGVIAFFIVTSYLISRRKTTIKYSNEIRKLERQIDIMGMETISMKQCMKRVIIKNKLNLDENATKILKLPNVEIEITPISKINAGTSIESEYILPTDDQWEFSKSNLILGRCLGEGEFGKVVQGEAKNILKENITTTVAVKMLKDDHSDNDMIALVSEMEIMKLIGTHVNVLSLLGCCTQDGALFVITEYAQHGNLSEFLRKYLPSDGEITATDLTEETLIRYAAQVAKGMEYLASIKCIHRDLAARNILVSENYILKIADFGLSKDITKKQYYRMKSNGRLPVKWMAPESLCHNIYSTQSDVWSYGVLLWEIFTLGGVPYPSLLDLGKIYQALRSGYRMEIPPNCSVEIYSLMQKCWNFRPKDRPLFSTIVESLQDILSSHYAVDNCGTHT